MIEYSKIVNKIGRNQFKKCQKEDLAWKLFWQIVFLHEGLTI